ncbi:dsRBD fold-containing protein [Streptomyces sp. NPDC012769]|uniref:dsRBD fold-containing protein n=1 Tax=Streptomyces sp. NPDC012769 TaxID=3364848 RepID=UPI00369B431E
MPEPHVRDTISYSEHELTLKLWSDGTNTTAEISDPSLDDKLLGQGDARRRKGDTRQQSVGDRLAIARALVDFAGDLLPEGYEDSL